MTTIAADALGAALPARSETAVSTRLAFMDNLRYLMIVLVLVYHSVAAYAVVAPHWAVHDTSSLAADIIRELFDVFMMPVLFFISGYFALASLEKKGAWAFIKDKFNRLLVPWALAVLIVAPLVLYDQPVKPVTPYWRYWLWYLGQFETRLRYTQTPVGVTTQMIYWFLSLLFAFSLLLALGYQISRRWPIKWSLPFVRRYTSGNETLIALLMFGGLTSILYFILLLFIPDSSWFTLQMFLEFQVTRLVPYVGCFAFGVYAYCKKWFTDGKLLGSLPLWGLISLFLAVVYIGMYQPMFADVAGTASFSTGYLLAYAVLRSFLLLALLVVFSSFGVYYWNVSSRLDQQLSATSYNIYLVHIFIVVAIQDTLLRWAGGLVPIKILIAFLVTLGLSFAISKWILARHARAFTVFILLLFAFCLVARP
jgi:glucan biosynthesis protein C